MDHYNKHQYPQYQYASQNYNQYQTPAQQYQQNVAVQNNLKGWFDYSNPSYIKGAIVGAALATVLTNPTVQKALVKGVVGIWGSLQGGVEELKEQIRDVQAEKGAEANE